MSSVAGAPDQVLSLRVVEEPFILRMRAYHR